MQVQCVTKQRVQNQSFIDKLNEDTRALHETLRLRKIALQKISPKAYGSANSDSSNIDTEDFERLIQDLNSSLFPMHSRLRTIYFIGLTSAVNTNTLDTDQGNY